MAVIFFIPVITQLVVVVTKLLLLLIFVIKVVPTIASGSAVTFFCIGDQILRILPVVVI